MKLRRLFLVNTEEFKTNISSVQCNMLSMNAHRYQCRVCVSYLEI